MESSLVFFSAARAAPKSARERIAQIRTLRFIATGHCTPVQAIEKCFVLPPVGLRLDVQLEKDLLAEQRFHLFPRLGPYCFQHSALGADEDALLALLLHVNGGQDVGDG